MNIDFHPSLLDSITTFLHKLEEVKTYETKKEISLIKKEISEIILKWESQQD